MRALSLPTVLGAALLLCGEANAGTIHLASGDLDPASPKGRALSAYRPSPGPQLRLVQLAGPTRPEWIDALSAAGVTVIDYIPESSYLVWGDEHAIARLDALTGPDGPVRWHGEWAAELKVDAPARAALAAPGNGAWAIQLVDAPAANAATLDLIARSKSAPEIFRAHVLRYLDIVVPLPAAAAAAVAARPDVISVKAWSDPLKMGERDAQIVAGNLAGNAPAAGSYLTWLASQGFAQSQFTASTFVVDITDSGLDNGSTDPDHPGLRVGGVTGGPSRVAYMRLVGTPSDPLTFQGCDGHGTISAHVLAGFDAASGAPHTDAAGFHYGLGICPFVAIGNSVVFDPWRYTHPNPVELASHAYADGARISSNGWGMPTSGGYDILAQAFDALVRDAQPGSAPYPAAGNQELVMLFAAGNAGPAAGGITSPGTAKNVITVGAAEGVQPFGGADQCGVDDSLSSSANDIHPASGRGPTADGRMKPDVVAPGTHVSGGVPQASSPDPTNGTALACYASGDATTIAVCGGTGAFPAALYWPETGQQLYTASSGTSIAAAAAAGAAALVRQRFVNQSLPAPSAAMTKAILVNSARYLSGAGANDTLPSPAQGMGEIDLGSAFDRVGGTATLLRDQVPADLFTASGQARTWDGAVSDTGKPVRVTLAFTDAPGSTAGDAWNNDLSLTVAAGGVTYRGNVFSGGTSAAGGSADARNNVESVFLPAGTTGAITITVTASNIDSDGVPGNGTALDQDFALVAYDVSPAGCATPAPTAGSNSPVCSGGTLNLTASGLPGAAWAWSGPGGFTSTLQNPSISGMAAANAGPYSVTQTVSGCTSPATMVNVTVTTTPAPTAGSNGPVAVGATIQLTASTVAGATYSWTGPNGFNSSAQNPTIPGATAANGGTYSVEATVGGCPSAPATTFVGVGSAAIRFYSVAPCRIIDTRNPAGPYGGPSLTAQRTRTFVAAGQCGISPDAAAVSANVTVVTPTTDGSLRIYPAGSEVPNATAISIRAGRTLANNALVWLSGSPGAFTVQDGQATGSTHFIFDVNGYFK